VAALDYPASPAHSHAVPQKSRAIVSSAISSSACHTPSPPTSAIEASHSFPNSRSRSPAKLSSKLRLDLPHAPCHQKLREAKLVPGYLLHAEGHTSESVLDCPPGTCTLSPLSPTICPTYPDTPSAQHHHAGAVSTGSRLRLVLDNEQRVRNRRGRPSETLRLATAQEIGHSGSLGSNAGGHAPSRALGLSRTRKTCLQPCSEAHQPPCRAVPLRPMRGCRFEYRLCPSLATQLFLFFQPTRIRSALSKTQHVVASAFHLPWRHE